MILLACIFLKKPFWTRPSSRVRPSKMLLFGKKKLSWVWDGWAWNDIKAFSSSWFVGLAVVLRRVETAGWWPLGLLDASNAMIPKEDSTPLGQRPLCVLPVVYRLWASVRLAHFQDWFYSWVRANGSPQWMRGTPPLLTRRKSSATPVKGLPHFRSRCGQV